MHSDLFDLLFTLRATPGGAHVLPFLTMQRGAAYQGQRGRRQLDEDDEIFNLAPMR